MDSMVRSPQLLALFSKGRVLRVKKGSTFTSTDEGEDVMYVVRGFVKRYGISTNGALGTQIIYGPQDVFSLTKVYTKLLNQKLYDGPEVFYYETMADSQLYSLSLSTFAAAVEQQPDIYKELFSEAGRHLEACVNQIESNSLPSVYARVAHLLLFMLREYGEQAPKGLELCNPLTHQDIADVLGVTRTTVTLAVVRLRNKGLLLSSRHFTVPDIGKLEAEAYGS
jgi:CRP-like cAMP-binding protein